MSATAVAHPNIALSKYWGKREGAGNFPAVPSLSVTLSGMATRTRVRFAPELRADRFVLDGREADGARVTALLDRVRSGMAAPQFAEVVSQNDFPTASGLASSASGFAALAVAATRAAGLASAGGDWTAARVSDLARASSASAARSVFGGFVELAVGERAASVVAPAEHLDLYVVVAVATEAKKATGSTDGMRETAARSPYYAAWLEDAPRTHARLRAALLARDFAAVGELAEASAMAMHASAIAAGIVYWNPATLAALAAVRELRAAGTAVYATIDAGPHVKVLALGARDAGLAAAALSAAPGVLRVFETRPGGPARVVETP